MNSCQICSVGEKNSGVKGDNLEEYTREQEIKSSREGRRSCSDVMME